MHLSTLNKLDKINLWHRHHGHFNINPIKNKLLKINIKSKCPMLSIKTKKHTSSKIEQKSKSSLLTNPHGSRGSGSRIYSLQ